jgi:uncharacterized protein with FMN-binding domain
MWILIVLGVLVAAMGAGIIATAPGRQELKGMAFPDTAFGNLNQGTYVGEYKGTIDSFRNEKVQVTVADGKVAEIKVLEGSVLKDGKPNELSNGTTIDSLSGRVIDAQSLHVDVISGATLTSNAHLKAVENALMQAGNK